MELKNKKYIKNTSKLRKFDGGLSPSQLSNIQQMSNFAQKNWVPGSTNTNNYSLNGVGYADTSNMTPNVYQQLYANPYLLNLDPYVGHVNINQNSNLGVKNKQTFNPDIAPESLGFVGNVINSFRRNVNANNLVEDAESGTANYRGVGYSFKNNVSSDVKKDLNRKYLYNALNLTAQGAKLGASVGGGGFSFKNGKLPKFSAGFGALFGGTAGAILGGLGAAFSSSKDDEEIRKANRWINREDLYNKNMAGSIALLQDFYRQYGDTRMQSLRSYKEGLQPVITPDGFKLNEKPDSKVSSGEIIGRLDENGNVESAIRVPGKKNNNDRIYAKLADGKQSFDRSYVISNKGGFSDYAAESGDIIGALAMQADMKNKPFMMNNRATDLLYYAKNGKLPRLNDGWDNAFVHGLGVLGGLALAGIASSLEIKRPNTYVGNPYAQRGMQEMAKLHASPYPILPELYNQYAKTMFAISNSGGLSGGLRTLARLSALNNLQNNFAKLQQSNQMQNNQYAQSYADYITKLGAEEAANRMNALRYDLDYYSKAHRAKNSMINAGLNNALGSLLSYYKNKNKNDLFNRTMALYEDDLKTSREYNEYLRKLSQQL